MHQSKVEVRYLQIFQSSSVLLQLTIALDSLCTECDHRAVLVFQKVPVTVYKQNTPEYLYMQLLTPYALGYVVKQLSLIDRVKILDKSGDVYEINTTEGIVKATATDCSCGFRKSMLLPCRHIFAVRSSSRVDLYSPELCATRWTLAYYQSNHRVLADPTLDLGDGSLNVSAARTKTQTILSQQDKYRKAFHVAQRHSGVVSESPMREFNEKMQVLKRLLNLWEQGDEVVLQRASDIQSPGTDSCL